MKWISLILCLLAGTGTLYAQPVVRTLVPQQPVVAGEAFLVQYILEGGDPDAVIQPPEFSDCRLITGPNVHHGNSGKSRVSNFVYSLEATRPGKLMIPGTTIYSGNKSYRSSTVYIDVITKKEAALLQLPKNGQPLSEYYLRPGEDPYQKIRENLFVKVQVNKRQCRVGEVVLATFKLYSRLESKSDIVKNPGFYGFTVFDMAGLADQLSSTEKINGQVFDVHTIRKVQLYPLQAGRYTIDPMEVKNRVEFSRTAVSRKTEQQIAEGMMGIEEDVPAREGTDVYVTSISTPAVEVEVKPLPVSAVPASFNGAVGRFELQTRVSSQQLSRNQQGYFEVRISGKGNFTQLTAPVIQWPQGVEGFDPQIIDELDKSASPLKGTRVFRFPFVSAVAGRYELPGTTFSFFDTDSNRYRTLNAPVQPVTISNTVLKPLVSTPSVSLEERNEQAARKAAIIAVAVVVLILLYWIFGSRRKKEEPIVVKEEPSLPPAADWLKPALQTAADDDQLFCSRLRQAIWDFAAAYFHLSGTAMNKQELTAALADPGLASQLIRVLEICDAGMFTMARMGDDRELLVQQALEVLEKIESRQKV